MAKLLKPEGLIGTAVRGISDETQGFLQIFSRTFRHFHLCQSQTHTIKSLRSQIIQLNRSINNKSY